MGMVPASKVAVAVPGWRWLAHYANGPIIIYSSGIHYGGIIWDRLIERHRPVHRIFSMTSLITNGSALKQCCALDFKEAFGGLGRL